MATSMTITTEIPLWGIITVFVTLIGVIIKIAVDYNGMKKELKLQQAETSNLRRDLEKHKEANDKEVDRVIEEVGKLNNLLIEVRTMVGLMMEDKIKK